MTVSIRVNGVPGERRIAVLRDGVLAEHHLWRPARPDGVGDIHLGRVRSVARGLAGAFVDLGGETGFLPDSASPAPLREGQGLPVQITRAAQGGKGPRLSARLEGFGTQGEAPRLLARGPDPVARLLQRFPQAEILTDEAGLAADLGGRAALVAAAFDPSLEDEIAALSAPTVESDDGARIHIHPTPALTAIDCDSGRALGDTGKGAAHGAVNRTLLTLLARQIALRNISGVIMVDFAGLSHKRRAALLPVLGEALAGDPLGCRVAGLSHLGLAELVRPRVHPPLHELMAGSHAAGLRLLRRALREAPTTGPLEVRAPTAIRAALLGDPGALAFCEAARGYPVRLLEG